MFGCLVGCTMRCQPWFAHQEEGRSLCLVCHHRGPPPHSWRHQGQSQAKIQSGNWARLCEIETPVSYRRTCVMAGAADSGAVAARTLWWGGRALQRSGHADSPPGVRLGRHSTTGRRLEPRLATKVGPSPLQAHILSNGTQTNGFWLAVCIATRHSRRSL